GAVDRQADRCRNSLAPAIRKLAGAKDRIQAVSARSRPRALADGRRMRWRFFVAYDSAQTRVRSAHHAERRYGYGRWRSATRPRLGLAARMWHFSHGR